MSFSDWLTFANGFVGYFGEPAIGTTTSWFPTRALVMASISGSYDAGGSIASANAVPNTLPKGFTSGKLRTLINPVISGPSNHGLICMQSADNMQGGLNSKGYAVMLDSILFSNRLVLVRMNDGISASLGGALGSSYSALGYSANGVWVQNTIYALEIEWHVNTLIPGTHVIGRFGTMTDFSDLTVFAEVFDNTSHAVLTSVGEGPYAMVASNPVLVTFDNTQLFSMTP